MCRIQIKKKKAAKTLMNWLHWHSFPFYYNLKQITNKEPFCATNDENDGIITDVRIVSKGNTLVNNPMMFTSI